MKRLLIKMVNGYFTKKADESYFDNLRSSRLEVIRQHNINIDEKAVLPPWVKYPEYELYGLCWNMKKPKEYLKKVFLPFWSGLSDEDKVKYAMRYYIDTEWATMWIQKLFAYNSIRNSKPNL